MNDSVNAVHISMLAQQFRYAIFVLYYSIFLLFLIFYLRYGGNFSSSTNNTLNFEYLVTTSSEYYNGAWGVNGLAAGWTSVPSLSFASLVNSGPIGALTYSFIPLVLIILNRLK